MVVRIDNFSLTSKIALVSRCWGPCSFRSTISIQYKCLFVEIFSPLLSSLLDKFSDHQQIITNWRRDSAYSFSYLSFKPLQGVPLFPSRLTNAVLFREVVSIEYWNFIKNCFNRHRENWNFTLGPLVQVLLLSRRCHLFLLLRFIWVDGVHKLLKCNMLKTQIRHLIF